MPAEVLAWPMALLLILLDVESVVLHIVFGAIGDLLGIAVVRFSVRRRA